MYQITSRGHLAADWRGMTLTMSATMDCTTHMQAPTAILTLLPHNHTPLRPIRLLRIPILVLLFHHFPKPLLGRRLAKVAHVHRAHLTRQVFHLASARVDAHKEADVKIDREGEERGDVPAVSGGSDGERVEHEAEGDFVRVFGVDRDAAVLREPV